VSEHECPRCHRSFDSRRGLGVHHNHAHGDKLPNRECDRCGTEFYNEHEQRYCSDECRDAAVSRSGAGHPNWQGGKERTGCEICGTEFEYYPSEKPGLYCPDCVETENWRYEPDNSGENSPLWTGGKQEIDCDSRGTTFERQPGNIEGEHVFCGRDCQYEWLSEEFTGEGHPNWAGGGMPNYRGDWREVRRKALERDDRTCVACGANHEELGRNPDVHHTVPVRAYADSRGRDREDAHRLDNVVCLCPSCHRRAEFGNIERERLRELAGIENTSE
jgi:hypothetical protein